MSNTLPSLMNSDGPWEPTPNRKRITRKECEFLEQNGFLTERYELIDGEILSKMGQNPPHALTINLVRRWLAQVFGEDWVSSQSPMDTGLADPEINSPEPDAIAHNLPHIAYATRFPGPAEIALLVEVSESTLRFDLRNKARLYARAGILDYWVMDIVGRRLIVHREPTPEGYAQITEYAANETVSPLSRPDVTVEVSSLLPPIQP